MIHSLSNSIGANLRSNIEVGTFTSKLSIQEHVSLCLVSQPNFESHVKFFGLKKKGETLGSKKKIHGICLLFLHIDMCKASLVDQSYYDKLRSLFVITQNHSFSILIEA